MPRSVIITDFATTPSYDKWLREIWPNEADRPVVIAIPVSQAGSTPHENWVRQYRATNGGFLSPFLASHGYPDGSFDQIGLIGFSAGCWGVGEILKDPSDASRVSFVYACDGLHGGLKGALPSYEARAKDSNDPTVYTKVGQHWIDYAEQAASGHGSMVVTFSRILPPYVGTRETAITLAREIGATSLPAPSLSGVEAKEAFGKGGFIAMGFNPPNAAPDGKEAHIYQANNVQEAVWRTLVQNWSFGNRLLFGAMTDEKGKILFLIGVLSVGLFALYRWKVGG